MRHKGTSVLVASQDPPSVPVALIELSPQIVLHRFNSPAWLKYIQKANAALASLSPEQLARLSGGRWPAFARWLVVELAGVHASVRCLGEIPPQTR